MQSTLGPKVMGCVLLLAWASGCPTSANHDAGAEASSGGPPSDDSICPLAPACAGVQLDDPSFEHGWAMGGDGAPLTLFLSSPGTACGNENPMGCTSCGIYESVTITLPLEAQAPGVYDETQVDMECHSWVSDCHGNGGGEDGPPPNHQVEIVSIDGDCIVGELLETSWCSANEGPFAVARCQ